MSTIEYYKTISSLCIQARFLHKTTSDNCSTIWL